MSAQKEGTAKTADIESAKEKMNAISKFVNESIGEIRGDSSALFNWALFQDLLSGLASQSPAAGMWGKGGNESLYPLWVRAIAKRNIKFSESNKVSR